MMGKKKCELCEGVARMHCDSDQASLCWDCDGKVHGANFLVAKHTRCLLCSVCQSPTSWKASGIRLGPTVSICESCLARKNNSIAGRENINLNLSQEIKDRTFYGDRLSREDDGAESYNDDEDDEESDEEEEEEEEDDEDDEDDEDEDEDEEEDDEDEEEDDEDEEEEEEEEADNQVVPWDATEAAQQPPLVSSSSSVSIISEEDYSGDGRTRRDSILYSSDEESKKSRPLKRSRDLVKINGYDDLNIEITRRKITKRL